MRDDTIIDRLADFGSAEDAARAFSFHGTGEAFEGPPRGGGFDGVFWCAGSPAVAQCYIPAAGIESFVSASGFELGERVRPSRQSDWYGLVKAMGFESPDVEWGPDGQARSWAVPAGYPTMGEVCDWLEARLGYANVSRRPEHERAYRIKMAYSGDGPTYLPAGYMAPGRLFIVDGLKDLRFLDLAAGREGDLTDPDHLKVQAFHRAAAAGYDGVIINDFCQSSTYGNVGHVSWGVLPSALHRIRHAVIPAVRFDWPADSSGFEAVTPEFEAAWQESCLARPAVRL